VRLVCCGADLNAKSAGTNAQVGDWSGLHSVLSSSKAVCMGVVLPLHMLTSKRDAGTRDYCSSNSRNTRGPHSLDALPFVCNFI